MGIFIFAFIVSALLLSITTAASRSRFGIGGACSLTGLSILPCIAVGSLVLIMQSLLTLLAGIVCLTLRARPRSFIVSAIGATIISYAWAFWLPLSELSELVRLREEYPLESVAHRLAYEIERDHPRVSAPKLSAAVDERLKSFEQRSTSNIRRHMLWSLHDKAHEEFVMARGFGPIRMASVRIERIELPPAEPIPLPNSPKADENYDPNRVSSEPLVDRGADQTPAVQENLRSLHIAGLEDFLNPEPMGYIIDREHVAGFVSHQFRNMPQFDADKKSENEWQVIRLELVSLLKHETPVAYISEYLPRMDKLGSASTPTRPLNGFERRALERLRYNEDLVVDEGLNGIRMLGSLRAGTDCLECHSVKRGALLGAFSYELHRVKPIQPPKKKQLLGPQAWLDRRPDKHLALRRDW